jgi:hypothetical protein
MATSFLFELQKFYQNFLYKVVYKDKLKNNFWSAF